MLKNLEKWLKRAHELKTDSALGIEVEILFVRHKQKDCSVSACFIRQGARPAGKRSKTDEINKK